jgi:diguanylate cyclase (GGDEF)-like protein
MADQENSLDRDKLESLLLLKGVDLESIRGLLEDCPVQQLKRGEVLIHAEKPNQFLYLLVSGRLRIHLKLDLDSIAILESGEVVGELSLIDRQLTSAYVVAEDDCRLLVLDEETLWSLVDASPIARNLLFILARRLRHADSLILSNQESQREYERYAFIDGLTSLYDRRWLESMLAWQIIRFKRKPEPLSLLLIGIDDFKQYLDAHGPTAGDRVIHTVARTLLENMRQGEILARYEEAEFIALLLAADAPADEAVGERLREAVSEAKIYSLVSDESPLPSVTISVGVAQLIPEDTLESFVAVARQALNDAREGGDNRVFKADRPS